MYEAFFQLQARPFLAAPWADAYFPGQAIEAARQQLLRVVDREEGTGLVIGAPGTGKSLLLAVLGEQFAASHRVVRLGAGYLNSRRALLQSILHELGGEYRGLDENETRLELIDQLAHDGSPRGLLLVIDEAQILSVRILDELRLMSNLCRQGQPRVRLVLAGLAGLEERLADPRLAAFQQRVAARAYLGPWSRGETLDYVRHELTRVGGRVEAIFANEALEQIQRATEGLPRLVNQLCDHALWLAYAGGVRSIGRAGIEEAWADLQQLPSPWQHTGPATPVDTTAVPGIVEFGSLDDDSEDEPGTPASDTWPKVVHGDAAAASARSLDELDRHLQLLDEDDARPTAGEPEVEFVFPEPRTTWDEPFIEEEVVLDGYAELAPTVPLRRVSSAEGRDLSARLEQVRLWPESLDGALTSPAPVVPAAVIRDEVTATQASPTTAGGAGTPREMSAELPPAPSPRRGTSIRIPPPADLPPAYAPATLVGTPGLPPTASTTVTTAQPTRPATVVSSPSPLAAELVASAPETTVPTPARAGNTSGTKPDFRRLFVKLRQQG